MVAPKEKQLRIRASTLEPFSAGEIAAIAASERDEEVAIRSSDHTVSTSLDFGRFKTGVPQYSHAHWNAANTGQIRQNPDDQIAVDPASLRADRDSLRVEICSNASSGSLASVKYNNLDKASTDHATSASATITTAAGNDPSLAFTNNNSSYATAVGISVAPTNMDSPTLRDMPLIAGAGRVPDIPSLDNSDELPSTKADTSNIQPYSTKAVYDGCAIEDDDDSPPPINPTTQVKDFADNLSDNSFNPAKRTDTNESDVSPEQDTPTLKRTFPLLKKRPAPIITDHPAYGSDPFTSSSDSPRISSSWTPSQVRTYNENQKTSKEEAPKAKNNLLNIVRASNPEQELITLAAAAKEGPPASPPTPPATAPLSRRASLAILGSTSRARAGTTTSTKPTTPSTRKFSPFSLRGIANAFQARPEPPEFTREERLQRQEYIIRAKTSSLPRPNASMFPTHPDTGRNWMHRNLRCIACEDKGCANCGKSCCAWRAAIRGLENHKDNGEGLERTVAIKEEIEAFDGRGKEVGTFMKCSDCEKTVCPECAGECCDEICKLVCCRKCKSDPWDVCDYHRDL